MKNNEIAVIIPSYNESKNIEILINRILKLFKGITIIIVDDSSGQEKHRINEFIKKNQNKNLILISRTKKLGRGSAVLRGFREGLKNKSKKLFFEMDSDLAHNPDEIQRFLNKIEKGNYDLIIGSRYIPGGTIVNVTKDRIFLSKIINIFLQFWLSIKVSDYTGGFRVYNRKAVEFLVRSNLKSKGFIMLSEKLYKLSRNGFRIGEVPISVTVRKHGKSNLDTKELINSLIFVIRMRLENFLEIK